MLRPVIAPRFARLLVAAATCFLLVALVAVGGCGKKKGTEPPPPPPPAPDPNSPAAALQLLEYCWDNRDYDHYTEIFTDDFRFCFAATDSAGQANYPGCSWTRDDELDMARGLFRDGVPGEPPASNISLTIDNTLTVEPDPRDGKDSTWHKLVRTPVVLTVIHGATQTNVTGFATFYLTRGDSASIPADLIARGFGPDSTRWYFDRWEDETDVPPHPARARPVRAQPTQRKTWGYLKNVYAL
jgi:hypothetical protein